MDIKKFYFYIHYDIIDSMDSLPYVYAFLGGILPALLWLLFFLREDKKHPEPRHLIFFTFLAGMVTVFFVRPVEQFAYSFLQGSVLFLAWSFIEEVFKYWAAFVVVLWQSAVDEPLDPLIYMITVALGFAAMETTLFLLYPFLSGNITEALITRNFRLMGAALLHTLSSAMIGGALALSFYYRSLFKRLFLVVGIVFAVLLHTTFNLLIMNSSGAQILLTFSIVWFGIIFLFLLFEKIKRIYQLGIKIDILIVR